VAAELQKVEEDRPISGLSEVALKAPANAEPGAGQPPSGRAALTPLLTNVQRGQGELKRENPVPETHTIGAEMSGA
jgi:hypothetical protein